MQSPDLSVQSHVTHTDDPWEVDQDHSFEVGSEHGEEDGLRAHGLPWLDADPHLTLNLSAEATKVPLLGEVIHLWTGECSIMFIYPLHLFK